VEVREPFLPLLLSKNLLVHSWPVRAISSQVFPRNPPSPFHKIGRSSSLPLIIQVVLLSSCSRCLGFVLFGLKILVYSSLVILSPPLHVVKFALSSIKKYTFFEIRPVSSGCSGDRPLSPSGLILLPIRMVSSPSRPFSFAFLLFPLL